MKRQAMKWLNELKLATIEEDIKQIEILMQRTPQFKSVKEGKEALGLISSASKIVTKHREKTLVSIKKLRLTKAFLNCH